MDNNGGVSGTADTLNSVRAGDRGATQTWLLLGAVAAVVAAIVVVLVVGYGRGTGGTDDVVAAPSVTDVPSTAASQSATTPTITTQPSTSTFSAAPVGELRPVPVAQQTPEGAVEFLEWYHEMVGHAEATGETELIAANSATDSEYAARTITIIDETYSSGLRIERTAPYSLSKINASEVDINGYVVVTFDLSDREVRTVDSTGAVVSSSPDLLALPSVAGIQWTGDRWLVTEIASDAE